MTSSWSDLVPSVEAAVAEVRRRIEVAGRDPHDVTLLAVTKGQPLAAVRAAAACALVDVGESYVQELVGKAADLVDEPEPTETGTLRWHLIGRLQRNKVRHAAPFVSLWQSIDRLSLAAEVAQHAPGARVLVQLNVSGSPEQGGCEPARAASLVEGCTDLGLVVEGFMAIGARGDESQVRSGFRVLRDLADRFDLPVRSMGMSSDLEAAVAEGSTMIRVGSALFGPRSGPGAVRN